MENVIFSTMIRSGHTTYFIDVKEAEKRGRYLVITEHRIDADSKHQRITIRIYGEAIEQFHQAITEAVAAATGREG